MPTNAVYYGDASLSGSFSSQWLNSQRKAGDNLSPIYWAAISDLPKRANSLIRQGGW